ncbi:MAG: PP0621 family protein [Azonexus sp.]|jgi:uncharacterized protein|nr:PP0621 family protein [Azonexus sp.]
MKVVLLVLVLLAAYWLFWGRRGGDPKESGKHVAGTEKMVVCAYCRLHIPQGESIASEGRHYCCDEHRQLDAS